MSTKKPAKDKPVIDLGHLNKNINQFYLGALRLNDQVEQDGKIIWLPLACHTLLCFSIELCLKWYFIAENGENPPAKHKLDELFSLLSKETQDLIKSLVVLDGTTFEEELKNIANDFVNIRYFSEQLNENLKINLAFSGPLADGIIKLINPSPKGGVWAD